MAVGTEETEVLQPVVAIVPVDVIELEWDWRTLPDAQTTSCTTGFKNPVTQQAPLQLEGLDGRQVGEISLEGSSGGELLPPTPGSTGEI